MTADRDPGDLLRELAPQGPRGRCCAGSGTSTSARTRPRRPCWLPRCSGPGMGPRTTPGAWLITVAARRLMDAARSEQSPASAGGSGRGGDPQSELLSPAADADPGQDRDDSLTLLFGCCHPALSAPSQIALTLRRSVGLTTAQIAAAFLVPEATMAQRISRAKQAIKASDCTPLRAGRRG